MLMVGLRLSIINLIEAQKVLGVAMELRLGIVTHESNGGTNRANVVFKSSGDLLFRAHRVAFDMPRSQSKEDLHHSGASMARDAIISSRSVTEEGVCGLPFIQTRHIGSREARLEMLSKGVMDNTAAVLGGFVKHSLDLLIGSPAKVGL